MIIIIIIIIIIITNIYNAHIVNIITKQKHRIWGAEDTWLALESGLEKSSFEPGLKDIETFWLSDWVRKGVPYAWTGRAEASRREN